KLPFSSMRLATFFSIIVALILIAPIAFASPPDPSWIAGVYDGADGDDVVTLVYETAGIEGVSLGSLLALSCASNVSLASGADHVHGFPLYRFTRVLRPRRSRHRCALTSPNFAQDSMPILP